MKRKLCFKDSIIDGDTMRDIIEIFPSIETNFTQRKNYDEYYYREEVVELSIESIEDLSKLGFIITINYSNLLID